MPFACQQDTQDFRCYATGEVIVATSCPRAFKMRVRLHKKYCADCMKYDDGKCHRLTTQNRSGGTMRLQHYKDTQYAMGLPEHDRPPPITKKGTYDGGTACNGGSTGAISILSKDSIEVCLENNSVDDICKLFQKKGK
jgi:hypothetical protein